MTHKAFSTAMRTGPKKSRPVPAFRDETIEQQHQRRAKEHAEQAAWHQRWLKGENK